MTPAQIKALLEDARQFLKVIKGILALIPGNKYAFVVDYLDQLVAAAEAVADQEWVAIVVNFLLSLMKMNDPHKVLEVIKEIATK
jgi:hypothetical protein